MTPHTDFSIAANLRDPGILLFASRDGRPVGTVETTLSLLSQIQAIRGADAERPHAALSHWIGLEIVSRKYDHIDRPRWFPIVR